MDDTLRMDERTRARRTFLKRAGQVAVTTPAVTLLLSAGTRSAARAARVYQLTDAGLTETVGNDGSRDEGGDYFRLSGTDPNGGSQDNNS